MDRIQPLQKIYVTMLMLMIIPLIGLSLTPEDIFPKMEKWERNTGDQVYTSDNLWNIINGAADAYLSYDFKKLYTAEYTNDRDKRMKVYIFQHSDPVNAFGIYSQERSSDYAFVSTGAQGFKSSQSYYFITGPYYVQISTSDEGLENAMANLAQQIDEVLDINDQLPETLALFPEKGKVPYSEKYIASNFMGYSYMHSAFISDYQHAGNAFRIFIIKPDNKQEINTMLEEYLDFVEYTGNKTGQEEYLVEDPYNGSLLLYQTGQYLCGIMSGNDQIKDKYLKNIKHNLK
jgi:hypothetical protein